MTPWRLVRLPRPTSNVKCFYRKEADILQHLYRSNLLQILILPRLLTDTSIKVFELSGRTTDISVSLRVYFLGVFFSCYVYHENLLISGYISLQDGKRKSGLF